MGFLQPITRWRFAAVAAVLGQLIFHDLHPLFQLPDKRDQSVEQGDHGFFALLLSRAHSLRVG